MIVNPLTFLFFLVLFWIRYDRETQIESPYIINKDGYVIDVVDVEYDTVEIISSTGSKRTGRLAEKGLRPKVIFTINNFQSGHKVMEVPRKLYITSTLFDEASSDSLDYSEDCNCYVAYNTGQTIPVNKFNKATTLGGRFFDNGNLTTLLIKPRETIRFIASFSCPPFPVDSPGTFSFGGYLYTDPDTRELVEVVFDIDIPSRKVVNMYYQETQ